MGNHLEVWKYLKLLVFRVASNWWHQRVKNRHNGAITLATDKDPTFTGWLDIAIVST